MARMSGREMAEALGDFMNGASKAERADFIDTFINSVHRTLQQKGMGTIFELIQAYAKLGPGQFDLRNEATVQLCKRIVEKFDKYDMALPFI